MMKITTATADSDDLGHVPVNFADKILLTPFMTRYYLSGV